MDKIITTVLLIVAGVICTIAVFNSVYPMVNRSSDAMNSMSQSLNEKMKSDIEIVHVGYEGDYTIYIWVKNVGTQRIVDIEQSDLFFGLETDFNYIPYVDYAGTSYPRWSYEFETGTEWTTSTTMKITISYSATEAPEGYLKIRFSIPNGISDEDFTSIDRG